MAPPQPAPGETPTDENGATSLANRIRAMANEAEALMLKKAPEVYAGSFTQGWVGGLHVAASMIEDARPCNGSDPAN